MAQSVSEMEPWQLARHGLNLLINNQPEEAHRLFQENNESIQMAAGYSFTAFMVNTYYINGFYVVSARFFSCRTL